VKGRKGKPKGMSETEYLMGNPENAARILKGMEEVEKLIKERRLQGLVFTP
jgi:hypothetical protein